tara:strand:+ start:11554 stop:12855 length:1302 start_codon:yes stop_codon:yes gene_type:complete
VVFIYFLNLLKLTFCKLFSIFPSKASKIIANHIFGKSFKFPEKITNNTFIVLTYYFRFLKTKVFDFQKDINQHNIIFDSSIESKEVRLKYLKYYTKIEDFNFVSCQELLYFKSYSFKIFYTLISIPFVLFFFVASHFSSYKSSLALFVEYPLILFNFFRLFKNGISPQVYYFSIYQRESNFFANYMQKKGLNVIKIPSEVPIGYWNANILCDELIICNYYQYKELIHFQDSVKFNKTTFWGPENSFSYRDLYSSKVEVTKNSIGYYSTGSWVRKKMGHIDQGIDFELHEKKLLIYLKEFLENNKQISLFIFLHPKEKSKDFYSYVVDFYKRSLGSEINFEIVDRTVNASHSFNMVDLGIAFSSTIMHERLFCGFKSIFFTRNNFFPLKNSKLYPISSIEKSSFINLLESSLKINTYEFFKKNDLLDYCYRKLN